MKIPLALILILLLFVTLTTSDAIYFYQGKNGFTSGNVITPLTYTKEINYHGVHIRSVSIQSSSYNLSIDVNAIEPVPRINTGNINVSSISSSYSGNTLYIVPIAYTVSCDIFLGTPLFSSLSLIFSNGNRVQLIQNGVPQNQTFVVPFNTNFMSINVSWELSTQFTHHKFYAYYFANVFLMVVLSNSKGVDYVYFWNISVTVQNQQGIIPIGATAYFPEYTSLNTQEILSILNSINN